MKQSMVNGLGEEDKRKITKQEKRTLHEKLFTINCQLPASEDAGLWFYLQLGRMGMGTRIFLW